MRTIHNIFIFSLILFACLMTSCEDMLETKNYTDLSPSNFFKSEGDIEAAVVGLYLPCTTNWGYSDGGTGKWYVSLYNADVNSYFGAAMVTTDIMQAYSSNAFDEFNVGPSNRTLSATYNVIRFVARATDVINQIDNCKGVSENVRNKYLAEVKTLRAFYMYTLLDFFGPVNVKLNPSTLMDNEIESRPSQEEYVGYITRDLDEAIATPGFPDRYNGSPSSWGHMSKAIALALKMRLSLHEKDWEGALQSARTIMKMGYKILPKYEDVFNNTITDETIWSVPANAASDNYYVSEVLPSDFKRGYNNRGRSYIRGNDNHYFAGWQEYCMRWDFYDTFQDNDVRKQTILCEYDTQDGTHKSRGNGMVGAIPVKFMDTQFANYGIQKAQPIVRYAEVLLAFAEAENELHGPTGEAVNAVRQITDRAGVEIPADAVSSKEAFRKFLLLERGHELFGEGLRRQDLIRNGTYIQRAKERGNKAQDYQVLFPIPQSVITESNGVVKQNPGYEQ